jgi:putative membrane protein
MLRLLASTSLTFMLAAAPVWAQVGNPAGMAPGTPQSPPGTPAPHQLNQQDRLFLEQAGIGGMAEVALGRLAEQRGQNAAVKDFARRMVQDHGKANDQLANIAHGVNVPVPQGPDPEQRTMQEQLEKLSGASFDVAYVRGQVGEHQKTSVLLAWEIGSGQDAELKRFAADTLPVVLDHLQMARDLVSQLTGQGPGLASATPRPETPPPAAGQHR